MNVVPERSFVTMPASKSAEDVEIVSKLIPRAYQEEVFTRAQSGNVIAALDTGSGKTFIAALLIKWITSLPEMSGKKVVFLVPKVPLVDQQREFLSAQTPLEVRGYIGAMNVDSWDASRWSLEFDKADVLIMTRMLQYMATPLFSSDLHVKPKYSETFSCMRIGA